MNALSEEGKKLAEYLINYKRYSRRDAESLVLRLNANLWEAIRYVYKLDTRGDVPWSSFFNHCRAVLPPNEQSTYFGRCDLKKHGINIDHALERGMDTLRWSTKLTE